MLSPHFVGKSWLNQGSSQAAAYRKNENQDLL